MNNIPETHTILLVDDFPENIDILRGVLSDKYSIKIAMDGVTALEIARTKPHPDLILLDIMMPNMDGYQVCEELKKDKLTANIPIIFVTALSEISDESKGLKLGAVDYIVKPVVPELVLARVSNQLELKMHRDNLQTLVDARTYQLMRSREATIEAMGIVAEGRDPETGGHIQRTKQFVRVLAEALANKDKYKDYLTKSQIELMYHSAPLHDLGKVAIPDKILLKPGKLTNEEFDEMKKHTTIGENTILEAQQRLEEVHMLDVAREIAGGHHEKWDGSGYPRGLKGDAIPLAARMMAIADVYDALTSRRPYKEPFSHDKTVSIIKEGSGGHFDPEIIEVFLENEQKFLEISKYYDGDI